MLDARKYAQHFPDEIVLNGVTEAKSGSVTELVVPSPSLLAALSQLEREFREILRAQQSEPTDSAE